MYIDSIFRFFKCVLFSTKLGKAFYPAMIEKNHGHIVTLASMAAINGTPSLCDYSSSKFAAFGFAESFQNELVRLDKSGVKTTIVCPYFTNTGMCDGVTTELGFV